ncbi:MAG TPA: outer membrane beta-barrel protein [Gemmatimonadaceae bacterium]|nr:outer membrane beta-barrel protein [Gemmatimonadaceae bacterium]
MQKHVMTGAALTLGLALLAAPASAQDMGLTRTVSFGIAAGATVPTGDVADFEGTGFNVMGTLGIQPVAMPIGVRFDVAYHSLSGEDFDEIVTVPARRARANLQRTGLTPNRQVTPGDGFSGSAPDLHIWAGTANAVLTVSNTAGIKPYVLGGIGLYNVGCDGCDSETKFGLNGGGGLEFGLSGFNTFIEARFQSIFTEDSNTNIIPIVFGIRF